MIDAAGEGGLVDGTKTARDAVTAADAFGTAGSFNVEERGEGFLPGVPYPVRAHGLSLQPHRDGNAIEMDRHMSRIDCPAGQQVCWQAYNAWNDCGKQHDCAEDVGLRFVLCG